MISIRSGFNSYRSWGVLALRLEDFKPVKTPHEAFGMFSSAPAPWGSSLSSLLGVSSSYSDTSLGTYEAVKSMQIDQSGVPYFVIGSSPNEIRDNSVSHTEDS